jgi:hypothetical protein
MWGGVGGVIEVMARCVQKIAGGRVFGCKFGNRAAWAEFWAGLLKCWLVRIRATCRVIFMLYLRSLGHAMMRGLGQTCEPVKC